MDSIWFALWFFLPAGLANVVPVFVRRVVWLRDWDTPMDFGYRLRDKQVFGKNKTWRGLIIGVLVAVLVAVWQKYMFENSPLINGFCLSNGFDYSTISPVILGGLLGFGALVGDAIESLIKRQIGVKPGQSWFPFDQLDYIVGALLASSLVVMLDVTQYLLILLVWFFIHLLVSYIGYLLKLKERPI